MDIERLSKIKQICFKQGRQAKNQPQQMRSKSPLQRLNEIYSKQSAKENIDNTKNNQSVDVAKGKKVRDPLRRQEMEVREGYQRKQVNLQNNINQFNEQLKRRNQRASKHMTMELKQRKSMSPVRGAKVASPIHFMNQKTKDNLHHQRSTYTPETERRGQSLLFSGDLAQMFKSGFNFKSQEQEQQPLNLKVQRVYAMLIRLIDQASSMNGKQTKPLLNQTQVAELKMRLEGAFERMGQIDQVQHNSQLMAIIEASFTDLYVKIVNKMNQGNPNLHNIAYGLFEQIAVSNLEDIVPDIVQTINSLKGRILSTCVQSLYERNYHQSTQDAFQVISKSSLHQKTKEKKLKSIMTASTTKMISSQRQKAFMTWAHITQELKQSTDQKINLLFNCYLKQLTDNASELSTYFKETKAFIQQAMPILSKSYIDVIIFKNDHYTTNIEGSSDENIQIDMGTASNLKSMISKSKQKYQCLENIISKKDFNIEIDLPFIKNKDKVLKKSQDLSQILVMSQLRKRSSQSSQDQYIYLRVTTTDSSIIQNKYQAIIQLQRLLPLIINAWASFIKLNKQYHILSKKMELIDESTTLSDKTLHMLQYIQSKTCELSLLQNVSDVFTLLNTISREIYGYDKCQVLQYNQGQVLKLYDATKGNNAPSEVGYIEEPFQESMIARMFQQLNEGGNGVYIQEVTQTEDSFDMRGQSLKDCVLIALDLHSTNGDHTGTLSSFYQTNQSSIIQNQTKNFIRLEKKLKKAKHAEAFETKCDNGNVFRAFSLLCLISISKIIMINSLKHQPVENINHLELSKVSQENEELKRLVQISQAIDVFIAELKENKALNSFEHFESKIAGFLEAVIPHSRFVKVFLSKDPNGQLLYTYTQNQQNILSNHISLLGTSKFQSMDQPRAHSRNGVVRTVFTSTIQGAHEPPRRLASQLVGGEQRPMSYHQHLPSQLDDISSISAGDAGNTVNNHDKTSLFMGTFSLENQNQHQTTKQQFMTRQPSSGLFASSSQNQLQRGTKDSRTGLKRDNSAHSELNVVKTRKMISQLPELVSEEEKGTSRKAVSTYDEMIHEIISNEFEVASNSYRHGKIEVKPYEHMSVLSQCIQQRQPLIKRNLKKDKAFNVSIDGLCLQTHAQTTMLENALYMPMMSSDIIVGAIQIANCEKDKVFEDYDLEVASMVAQKLAFYIAEQKQVHCDKQLFKKQMEVSVLHTSLESQSLTKILTLANKLFSSQLPHSRAIGLFMTKTEKYLTKAFGCQVANMLLVDQHQLLSVDYNRHKNTLTVRGELNEHSVACDVLNSHQVGPFIHPQFNDYIFIGDNGPQQMFNHINPQSYNPSIDLPLNSELKLSQAPKTYLIMVVRDTQEQPLCIVQLMAKNNGYRFTDQDAKHLTLVCNNLSQVFTHIFHSGYMQQLSITCTQAVTKLTDLLDKKYKSHLKHLFRELLAFKYGKANLLKNKIVRKHLDHHMKIDQAFVAKMKDLIKIKERVAQTAKASTLRKLKSKVKTLNEQRKQNGMKCLRIMAKYDNILSIRVKDTAFAYWTNKKQRINTDSESFQLYMNESRLGQTFSMDQSALTVGNNSSMLVESSITSVMFQRAKAAYKFRKLFNNYKLRIYFDSYAIRVFGQTKFAYQKIQNERIRQLVKLGQVINSRKSKVAKKYLTQIKGKTNALKRREQVMKKLAGKKLIKTISFGLKQWQSQTDESIRRELQQEKSYCSQLSEQCKDANLLSLLVQGISSVTASLVPTKSIEENVATPEMKSLLTNVCDFFLQHTLMAETMVITLKLPFDEYSQRANKYMMFRYKASQETSSSIIDIFEDDSKLSIIQGPSGQYKSILDVMNVQEQAKPRYQYQKQQDVSQPKIQIITDEDLIIRSAKAAQSSFIVSDLAQDTVLEKCLETRLTLLSTQAMFIPLIDNLNKEFQGTIEVYSLRKDTRFSNEEQIKFNLYAKTFSLGIQSMLKQLALIQEMSVAQISNVHLSTGEDQVNKAVLSGLVKTLSIDILKAMKANHCTCIFVPPTLISLRKGLVFNLANNTLSPIDLQGTFLEDILKSGTNRQITFPSSLLFQGAKYSARDYSYQQKPKTFDTISGSKMEAVKCVPVTKSEYSNELIGIVEMGWSSIREAQSVHENDSYIYKKERLIKRRVQEEVKAFSHRLKLFMYCMQGKVESYRMKFGPDQAFMRWKEVVQLQHVAQYSPVRGKRRPVTQQFMTEKVQRDFSPLGNIIMRSQNHQIEPYQGRSSTKKQLFSPHEQPVDDLQVEIATKKKLVSASFVMLALTNTIVKKRSLQHAFAEWKSYITHTQVAECAFNKLLELNHKHSAVRYHSAVRILSRMNSNSKVNLQAAFERIFNCAHSQQREYFIPLKQVPMSYKSEPELEGTFQRNDQIFTLQELEDDQASEFSLGNGTRDMIQMKAESILEQARSQFKSKSYRK